MGVHEPRSEGVKTGESKAWACESTGAAAKTQSEGDGGAGVGGSLSELFFAGVGEGGGATTAGRAAGRASASRAAAAAGRAVAGPRPCSSHLARDMTGEAEGGRGLEREKQA